MKSVKENKEYLSIGSNKIEGCDSKYYIKEFWVEREKENSKFNTYKKEYCANLLNNIPSKFVLTERLLSKLNIIYNKWCLFFLKDSSELLSEVRDWRKKNEHNIYKYVLCLEPSKHPRNYYYSLCDLSVSNLNYAYNQFNIEGNEFKLCIITKYPIKLNIFNTYVIDIDTFAKEFSAQYNKINNFNLKIINTCYILYDISGSEFILAMSKYGIYITGGPSYKAHILSPFNFRLYVFLKNTMLESSLNDYYNDKTIIDNEIKQGLNIHSCIQYDIDFFLRLKDKDQGIIKNLDYFKNRIIFTLPPSDYTRIKEKPAVLSTLCLKNIQNNILYFQTKLLIIPYSIMPMDKRNRISIIKMEDIKYIIDNYYREIFNYGLQFYYITKYLRYKNRGDPLYKDYELPLEGYKELRYILNVDSEDKLIISSSFNNVIFDTTEDWNDLNNKLKDNNIRITGKKKSERGIFTSLDYTLCKFANTMEVYKYVENYYNNYNKNENNIIRSFKKTDQAELEKKE